MDKKFILHLEEVGIEDVGEVGGKNASSGEMLQYLAPKGVNIPGGYAVTATAYRHFLEETGLKEQIRKKLDNLNAKNINELEKVALEIQTAIKKTEFPEDLKKAIAEAHKVAEKKYGKNADFACRSSATAEDLPDASFAGEHETFLDIRGADNVMEAVRKSMASLFTARAISYRIDKKFDHFQVALSVGVQKMVRSDLGCSGVMFSLDTETGFPNVVVVNGVWGLGEMIVQGEVTPDEFLVFKETLGKSKEGKFYRPVINKKLGAKNQKMVYGEKQPTKIVSTSEKERESFVISDLEALRLAEWAMEVEKHYSKKRGKWTPMDMEWAKDGRTGELFLVQARPETIHSTRDFSKIAEYVREEDGKEVTRGISVGNKVASGTARVILSPSKISEFKAGEVLVTEMTDPDWEPIMKIASAIVTDKGGRTSHAAIVSRELGIPCVVGTEGASGKIKTGDKITVDTTGSEGLVLEGLLKFKIVNHDVKDFPRPKTHVMMNIATPDTAFEKSFLPNDGVGLAREEFIIASDIGIHPLAILNFSKLPEGIKRKVQEKTFGYPDKVQYYVDTLAYGIAKVAAAFYPKPVIVRFSDFKTNEYSALIGGELYEPKEENPMLGWRGASRYYHPDFAPAFVLELEAIKKVRQEMGLTNLCVMVPFCRTPEEGKKVVEIIEKNGVRKDDLKIYVMCEIPANIVLADEFLKIFDGMSIGSNDLTQLMLGLDRDGNEKIRGISNENDEAVKTMIGNIIKKCRAEKKYIGICGQAPSDYPEFAQFLVREGIESISLNPDTVIKTTLKIVEAEKKG